MKNKFQIAMTLAVLLAMVITSLALADTVTSDVDAVVGNQTFIDLGNVTPGQVINTATSFQLVCSGNNHADQGNTVFVQYFNATIPGGTLTASDTSIGPIPVNWADDGGNCSSPTPVLDDNGNSTVTITAPTTAGTYDYAVTYKVCQSNNASLCGGIDPNDVTGAVPAVTFRLKVVTNAAPTITVNDVTKEGNTVGGWTLAFADIGSASDNEDGTPSVACSPALGSVLPLGATSVSCTATDSGGKTATDSGVVTVVDTTKPTISDNQDLVKEATGPTGAVATFGNPSASDIVDNSLTVGCVPTSGSTFALGHTTVTCTATDDSSNSAQSDFDVFVQDTTAPTIDPHGDVTAEATGPSGANVSYASPATHDAVDGNSTATCSPASGSLFPLGDTTVTCNATDTHLNAATPTTFKVHVVDTIDPTFSCGSADSIWHADNQSVACTASDSGSGLATPASFSLSTNVGADTETDNAFTGSQQVCDIANNCVTAGPVGPFKIDRKAPSVSATPDRLADFGGWYNHALTVTFSGTDGGSNSVTCTSPINYNGPDNASASVSGSCSDAVGNSASASFDFKYDGTAPTAVLSVIGGISGANGWYTSDVTVHTSGIGSVSGVTCTEDQFQNSETTGANFNGSCTSGAGLTTDAAPLTVKLDKTAPTNVMLTPSGTLGNNGWYVSNVAITTSGTETISTPLTCTAPQSQTTDTNGATFNGTCTNDAGLTTAADSLIIKRDATAPSIGAAVSPARPASGWWNIASGAPTVTYTCSDGTSGIASCTSPSTFGNGENQTHSGTAVDNAGNSASTSVSDIDVDLTAPTLAWVGGPANGASYYFGSVPAAPTCTAADGLSGPNGCTVAGYDTAVGSHTMTATAHDVAGNEYAEQRTYTVMAWTLKGFYQPVDMNNVLNTVKGGSTVPLKFEVFAGPTELTDTAVVSTLLKQVTCNTTSEDTVEVLATGGTSLRYDTVGGQFIFNWQTPKLPGKCYSVTMTTQDGSSITALFKLK